MLFVFKLQNTKFNFYLTQKVNAIIFVLSLFKYIFVPLK